MRKNIYITILLITQMCISQNIDTNCVKSDKTNPEIIINSYIEAIGGQKKNKENKNFAKKYRNNNN